MRPAPAAAQGGVANIGAGPQFHCRRFPPVVVPVQWGGITTPPMVTAEEWCGEFTAKVPALAAV